MREVDSGHQGAYTELNYRACTCFTSSLSSGIAAAADSNFWIQGSTKDGTEIVGLPALSLLHDGREHLRINKTRTRGE